MEAWIWAEKYRPTSVADVIIPESVRARFSAYIKERQIPNMMLTSASPGTGKTTTARALCNDIGIERPLFINASLNNSIDNIRMEVMQYATTMSMFGDANHKVVILDEADRLSPAAQDSLKALIEEVHTNCRFILTANTKSRITEPLASRCTNIEFAFSKEDATKMIAKMFKRSCEILDAENVPYDKKVVATLTQKCFPDNRSLMVLLQDESKHGQIDEGAVARLASVSPEALLEHMKTKNYGEVKNWVAQNADRINDDFYGKVFRLFDGKIAEQSVPQLVLILGDYQRFHSTVPDRFIHFLALATEVMMQVQFK